MRMENIKFKVSADWSVFELSDFLHAVNILYNRLYVLHKLSESDRKSTNLIKALKASLYYVSESDKLMIDSVEIRSPGEINLKGIGEIIKEVREFIKDISFRNKQEGEAGEQRKRQTDIEIEEREIDLFEKKICLLKKIGYTEEEIKEIRKSLINPAKKISDSIDEKNIELIDEPKKGEND